VSCPNCGTENEPGRKFCGECGTRLALVCSNCGTANSPGVRFCGECGSPFGENASRPAAATTAVAGAGSPTPATTGPAAAASPIAERRLVSVLFADLVGFTTIAEGRDHEEVRELLSRYFDVTREIIERYGGTVEKFIGDAVMAVWGAPTAHEDDAERAVRDGLDVVGVVPSLGPGIVARAGVVTGEAAVTLGATGQGMVAGDLVNTASRLQSAAAPGMVLVDDATERASSSAIAFEAAGEQVLKGKVAPVASHRAVRVVGERGGRNVGDRLEPPFVARDAELRLLKDLLHSTARERRLRLVSITGQAGVGKSRLAWELKKYVDGIVERILWHDGRSPAYGDGVTFWALGEMLRGRAGLTEVDDSATTRVRLHAAVERYVEDPEERERIEPALQALLGIGERSAGTTAELYGAWRTFFERMAAQSPVVLLFEDLHWADSGLLDFIDHILEWSRDVPILIVTLARPDLLDRRPDWGAGRRNFLAIDLPPLDDGSMRDLLAGLVPELPQPAITSIVGRSEGIPLYAVETIRMLVGDGRLREREGGGFEPAGELGDLAVPETLHALIAARLDGLEPAARSLVQDAAVLGQSFTPAGLAAVSGLEPAALDARLRELARADLLREELDPRSPERGQFRFVQALIREVAYSTLALRDRRNRHLAAARFFESLGDDELAGALAAHYLAAYKATPPGAEADALAAQSRVALRAAADRAEALGSTRQAVRFLEQALEFAGDDADQAAVLERAAVAATFAGDFDHAGELAARLIELRTALGDRSALVRAIAIEVERLWAARQTEGSVEVAEAALEKYADLGDGDRDYVRLLAVHAGSAAFNKDYEAAERSSSRALAGAERLGLADTAAKMLGIRAVIALFHARTWEATALYLGARDLAEKHGHPDVALRSTIGLSLAMFDEDPKGSIELSREIVKMARRLGQRSIEAVALGNATEGARRIGNWDQAIADAEAALEPDDQGTTNLMIESALVQLRALRGEMTADEVATIVARLERLDDHDVKAAGDELQAVFALAAGDFAGSLKTEFVQADRSDLNAAAAMQRGAMAAVLGGDAEGAKKALDRLIGTGTRGRAHDTDLTAIRGGIAAIRGDSNTALSDLRTARTGYRELGLPWDEALVGLAAGRQLDPADPEIRGWLTEARAIFEGLRARPFVAMADEALAGGGAGAPGAASVGATEALGARTA
jgi:class 3 adenylate cyclase